MATALTNLEWSYEPPDFFEASCTFIVDVGILTIGDGKASLQLAAPSLPTAEIRERAISEVTAVFDARRLLVHRPYTTKGPNQIYLDEAGRKHISVQLQGMEMKISGGSMDFKVTNAAGEVVSDSKRDRLKSHQEFVAALAPKVAKSPLLKSLLQSYGAAVSDPSDELVHLYEMRDALSSHFGSEDAARDALSITQAEWQRLGILANAKPLLEGRHRGRHVEELRPATSEELEAARNAAKLLAIRFAATVH